MSRYDIYSVNAKSTTLHFWAGSFCQILDRSKRPYFPNNVVAVSDIITLIEEVENQIPDKSWMLYLLEIFNVQKIPIELNLICQFDNQNYFEAIYNGVNQYSFRQVLPVLRLSYVCQIIMDSHRKVIVYLLKDQDSKQSESFEISSSNNFSFEGLNHFTGIEWWNRIGNYAYPIRYSVEISQLMYGLREEPPATNAITYRPYRALIPNNEDSGTEYPISFYNVKKKIENNCICYNVRAGRRSTGLAFSC